MEPDSAADLAKQYAEENTPSHIISISSDESLTGITMRLQEGERLVQTAKVIQKEREAALHNSLNDYILDTQNHQEWSNYYVSGSCTSRLDQQIGRQWTSDAFGKEFILTYNDKEVCCAVDYWNSACGLVSSRLGSKVEHAAVQDLRNSLKRDINAGRNVKIVAHSQGVIIAHNVTTLLSVHEDRSWWKQHASQVEIVSFGGAITEWPSGMKVVVYRQEDDFASSLVGGSSWCVNGLKKKLLGREFQTAKVISVDGSAHNYYDYIVKRSADFFVQDHLNRHEGKIHWSEFSAELLRSIRFKQRSDETHRELIDKGVALGGKDFLKNISPFVDRQEVENESTGSMPGDYTLGTLILKKKCGELLYDYHAQSQTLEE